MNKVQTSLIFLLLCVQFSCSDNECSEEIATGIILEKPFTFQTGKATENAEGKLFFTMYSNDVNITDVCNFSTPVLTESVSVRGSIPEVKVGKFDIGDDNSIWFFDNAEAYTAFVFDGFIELTEISETSVKGFMNLDAGDVEAICGTFELTLCM